MRFTRLQQGEDLAKVVRRAYRSEVKGGLAEAERQVIAVNPHLSDPAGARPGTLIVLPDVEGTRALGDSDSESQALAAVLAAALASLGDLGSVTEAGIARQEAEISGTLDLLKTKEVQTLGKNEPEAAKRLALIQQQSAARQKDLATLRATQKQALTEFDADAKSLLALLGGGDTTTLPPSPGVAPGSRK